MRGGERVERGVDMNGVMHMHHMIRSHASHDQELGVDVTPQLHIIKVEAPPTRKAGVMVSSVQELVDKLRDEAKVL